MAKSFGRLIKEFALGISLRLGVALFIILCAWSIFALYEEQTLKFLVAVGIVLMAALPVLVRG